MKVLITSDLALQLHKAESKDRYHNNIGTEKHRDEFQGFLDFVTSISLIVSRTCQILSSIDELQKDQMTSQATTLRSHIHRTGASE